MTRIRWLTSTKKSSLISEIVSVAIPEAKRRTIEGGNYVSYIWAGCREREPSPTERQHREADLLAGADCACCHPREEVEEED